MAKKREASKTKRTKATGKAAPRPKSSPPARTAEEMARAQREISVSEFFTKNRHLLGFDNPRKALLTTIKEGVDNALDACEEAGILPEITVRVDAVRDEEDRFSVAIQDNGPGIVRKQVPMIFAKLLYGSKFHSLRMSRGQQGIGISAAAMYGQLTTGKPTHILSRTSSRRPAHEFELMIDTRKNQPRVVSDQQVEWDPPHGTRVTIQLEARYLKGKQSVDEYLAQTAIANPHAAITYQAPGQGPLVYGRTAQELPPRPRAIKPHPSGIELGILIKMLQSTRARYVSSFLHQDFCRVSTRVAKEMCDRAGLRANARPKTLAKNGTDKLYKAMQQTRLMNPPTDCVVPIGEELMRKGLERGVEADFYATVTRPPAVYRGNPFVIEAGLAYGGDLPSDGPVRLLRFANRVPLQYQRAACAISRSVSGMSWRAYGLSQSSGQVPVGPMILMVHMASVWVPFTSESKEAVAHYPEILKQIKLALQECGRRLGTFLRKRAYADREAKRRSVFERYIGEVVSAVQRMVEIDAEDLHARLAALAERATTIGAENLPVYSPGRISVTGPPAVPEAAKRSEAGPAGTTAKRRAAGSAAKATSKRAKTKTKKKGAAKKRGTKAR